MKKDKVNTIIRRLASACLFAAASWHWVATAQDTVVFTLRDCMEYAISNSTQVRIQQADNGDSQIARRQAILSAGGSGLQSGTACVMLRKRFFPFTTQEAPLLIRFFL